MNSSLDIQEKEGHLLCTVDVEYTPENMVMLLNQILSACSRGGHGAVFVDLTSVKTSVPASLKIITGLEARQSLMTFAGRYGQAPRIAVLGSVPHITSHRPVEELMQDAGLPFAVFTDRSLAYAWLASDKHAPS